jgi:group I intron endonuclease
VDAQTQQLLLNHLAQVQHSKVYGVVYCIENTVSKKQYIGQTTYSNPQRRFEQHLGAARSGSQLPLYRSMRKNGFTSFLFTVLDSASDLESLNVLEAFYVEAFNTLCPNGYNLKHGGNANGKWSAELKEKLSRMWSENLQFRERILTSLRSDETRKKFSVRSIKMWQNQEIRDHIVSLHNTDQSKAERSARAIALWKDPEFRQRSLSSRSSEQGRRRRSESVKASWADPEKRANRLVSHFKFNSKGKIWITNGLKASLVDPSLPTPEGWFKGRVLK